MHSNDPGKAFMHLKSARIHNLDQILSLYRCMIDCSKMGSNLASPHFTELFLIYMNA